MKNTEEINELLLQKFELQKQNLLVLLEELETQLALETDLIIVVGSENSSNSNRLRELAENCGVESFLIDDPEKISSLNLDNVNVMGITAGASAPEELVQQMVQKCNLLGYKVNEEISGLKEEVYFKLPAELR